MKILAIDPGTTDSGPRSGALRMTAFLAPKPALTCDNGNGPRGVGSTTGGLTHSSDLTREGLGMQPTRDTATRAEDHLEGQRLVVAIGGLDHDVRSATLNGAPYSKSRPRFSRQGRTYVPKKDREAEDATAYDLRMFFPEPYPGNVALACIFYRPNYQRIDVDNMLKHVCDAANEILWADDSQVTALVGIARLDRQRPRTIVAVAHHASTLARGSDAVYPCVVCDAPISRIGQKGALKKTCSSACALKVRGLAGLLPVACPNCGETFKRATTAQRYCSHACYAEDITGAQMPETKTVSRCWQCGDQIKRPGRCRGCWRADPAGVQPPLPAQPELPLGVDL